MIYASPLVTSLAELLASPKFKAEHGKIAKDAYKPRVRRGSYHPFRKAHADTPLQGLTTPRAYEYFGGPTH